MKKLLTFLICTTSLYHSSYSQKEFQQIDQERFFRIGGKVGVNINKLTGQSYKSGFNYNYLFGGFMQFNFSNRFGIQPEVNFVQSSSEFTNDPNDVYNDLFLDGSQKTAKYNYLKVPLLLNINVGLSKHVKIQLGPQFGALLKETVDSLKTNRTLFKKSDVSAVGGLWIQVPFINLGARYELGLANVNDVEGRKKLNSQAFTIFAGFTF